MAGDWVKLYRSMMDTAIWSDDWLVRLWVWCLCKANYRDSSYRGEPVRRGQFITGRNTASDELSVNPSKWYRGIMQLAELGYVKVEANSVWTMITVCKYETYQSDTDQERTADEQRLNSERTADEQPASSERTLEKEFKKERIKERERETHTTEGGSGGRNPQLLTPAEVARQQAAEYVASWIMPTNAQEPRHREALAMWMAVRKEKHGRYLPENQWEAAAIKRASWDSDRWYDALLTSAVDGTANLATHQDDKRAASERNGNARYHKARLTHPSDPNELPL